MLITDNPAHDIPKILGMDFKSYYWAVKHSHATYLWVTKVVVDDYVRQGTGLRSLLEDRTRYKAIRESNNSHFTCILSLNVWISCGLKNGEV